MGGILRPDMFGDQRVESDLIPSKDGVFDLGAPGHRFRNIYLTGDLSLDDISLDALTFANTSTGIQAYNTADQTTNFERAVFDWDTNRYKLVTQLGGTGTSRPLRLGVESGASFAYLDIQRSAAPFLNFSFDTIGVAGPFVSFGDGTAAGTPSSASSGVATFFQISPYINQSATAGYTAALINAVENALGSGAAKLLEMQRNSIRIRSFFNNGDVDQVRWGAVGTAITNNFYKTRAVTDVATTPVIAGDPLGVFRFYGADGTNYSLAAELEVAVAGTPGAGDMPGRFDFKVSPDGSATPVLALRIDGGVANPNLAFFGAGSYGSGRGVVFIANAINLPSGNPTGGGLLYVNAGALTYKGSSGTVTPVAAA